MANRFHEAVARYRVGQVKSLLGQVVNINCKNSQGEPILLQALRIDNPIKCKRMFKFLLVNGANCLDVDPNTGRDVLTWACVLGRAEQVSCLLKSAPGAFDLKRKDLSGNTALHYAVESRDSGLVKTLAMEMERFWVSVDIPNDTGLTPYLLANKLGLQSIADILKTYGRASPNQFDAKTFRTSKDWYHQGKEERRRVIHKRVVADIKRKGGMKFYKWPSLQPSETNPSLRRSDTEIGVWLQLAPRKDTPVKVILSSPEESTSLARIQESPDSPYNDTSTSSSAQSLPTILDSYKDQLSSSYRVTAIPPPPPPPREESENINFGSFTTFTMVISAMKAKAAQSRKKLTLSKLGNGHPKKKLGRQDTVSILTTGGDGGKAGMGKVKKSVSVTLPPVHLKSTRANGQ